MKVEITNKKSNPLLSREEIDFKVTEINSTPKITDLKEKISALTESNSDSTVITEIKQNFGEKYCTGKARTYKDKEKMKEVELDYVLGRNFAGDKERIKKTKESKKAAKEKKKLESKKKKK
ncbi:MAG: 30S ribosomal protein S24e [Candidatus Diapherotrites archaeon CG10_big_fil_rev_8_21_14_0_10_31_34]|nr:MAG: 30S ribosomal protein S24e [Candidatus Diapherotrites archaeon CG10_big_fil_rev_8_21_14_0_10_31_34]